MADKQAKREELLSLTTEIVASYVSNNSVDATTLPQVMEQVFHTLNALSSGGSSTKADKEPAVPIKKSIRPDYLVCLEDGEKLKMLKRHLKTHYNLTPQEYREKWGLPSDYPMVAPNYADQRRELAKKIGLGRRKQQA